MELERLIVFGITYQDLIRKAPRSKRHGRKLQQHWDKCQVKYIFSFYEGMLRYKIIYVCIFMQQLSECQERDVCSLE